MLQQFSLIMHMHLCTFWLLLSDSSKLVQLDLHSLEREQEITSNKWLVKASCCVMWIIEPKFTQWLVVPGDQRCRRAEADTVSVQVTGPPFQLPILGNEDPLNSPRYFSRKWQGWSITGIHRKLHVMPLCAFLSADQRAPYGFPCCSLM